MKRRRSRRDVDKVLRQAREQQAVVAEILRAINGATGDVAPILDAITAGAMRLCDAFSATIYQYDGEHLTLTSIGGPKVEKAIDEVRRNVSVLKVVRGETLLPRVILDHEVINLRNAQTEPGVPAYTQRLATLGGYKGLMAMPMLREGHCVGALTVAGRRAGRFTKAQVELIKTLADQGALAIESARMVHALNRSVEEQKALAQISQVVSSTLDISTVLTRIVGYAVSLSACDAGAIYEYDPAVSELQLRVTHATGDALTALLRATPPRIGEGILGRAASGREPVQVPDMLAAGAPSGHLSTTLVEAGYRAVLAVPLLRETDIIGLLVVRRRAPGEFSPETIALIQTFAAQSALAILNARLFRELGDKSRELEVASRHKSQFLANMSHELRTPLNAIIGYTELLLEDARSPDDTDAMRRIERASHHLLNLINDILDLAKVEAGKMELDLADVDVRAAIEAATALVREQAERAGVAVHTAVSDGVRIVRADERKLHQVLLNLLSNAVKFTPTEGRIDVAARRADATIEIAVSDTGIGISAEDQAALFDEFRQVGRPAARVEGTGLGLALSRRFVELHGGTIRVESKIGAGSTFTVAFPAP